MSGAILFPMTDIYGGYAGTTEATVPEENDKSALVDEGKQTQTVEVKKSAPIYLGIVLILIIAFIMGAVK